MRTERVPCVNETIYNKEGFKGGERSRGVGKLNQMTMSMKHLGRKS